MLRVFSIAPPRLGGLDLLIPIYIEMKRCGNVSIELIVENDLLLKQLKRDTFLHRELFDNIDKITFIRRKRVNSSSNLFIKFLTIFLVFWKLLGISFRIFNSKAPILMHSSHLGDWLVRLMNKLVKKKKGITVAHYKLMTLPKKLENYHKNFGDIFLCFSDAFISHGDSIIKNGYISIGYPRLYESWLSTLRNNSKHFVDKEIRVPLSCNEKPLSVLFLPSTVKGVFEENELKEWIIEVLSALSKVFPESLVVLKPHPMQDMEHLKALLKSQSYHKCFISFLNPGLLASEARVVISHHSATIIDALALQTPVIQHQVLTNHWVKRHPDGSKFLKLGHPWTKDTVSLINELNKVKNNDWTQPKFLSMLEHNNSIKQFFDRINLSYK